MAFDTAIPLQNCHLFACLDKWKHAGSLEFKCQRAFVDSCFSNAKKKKKKGILTQETLPPNFQPPFLGPAFFSPLPITGGSGES